MTQTATVSETRIKRLVRKRDGYRCTSCGMTTQEHLEKYDCVLDVHRVVPGSEYAVEGCLTLCQSRHDQRHRGPVFPLPNGVQGATGLASQLKDYIRESGQSLRELSKNSGVDRGQLSRFLRGERDLTGASIERICQALDLRLAPRKGKGGGK